MRGDVAWWGCCGVWQRGVVRVFCKWLGSVRWDDGAGVVEGHVGSAAVGLGEMGRLEMLETG